MSSPADFIILSDETVTMLRELFSALDQDGDAVLTANDFSSPFNGRMNDVGRQKFIMLLENFDQDGDDCIEFPEFIYGFKAMAANTAAPTLLGVEGLTYGEIIAKLQIAANELIFEFAQELFQAISS
ncbi:uncharacterized protein AMSG_03163 [Thecamonas trahens ATCC 50062]|uniref:EF-hand domain-containing protein n=1 Tax=Thecamonas trahens ATCC 50062 TaxID=461836 RepID=A0A0L0D3G4_THETB|nr:hypothetical protein AMSG_03163 [Thecamonas trahens ATCC 50062]KNC46735.1 hypothetical protein AMSG_03163 [Thecamonas trahens ATCC 50062]|eukprot:XP_013760015.1 hypothetical protein AMSG_03163 [Thecamonas trahens ATCC 50062]